MLVILRDHTIHTNYYEYNSLMHFECLSFEIQILNYILLGIINLYMSMFMIEIISVILNDLLLIAQYYLYILISKFIIH